MGRSIKKRSRVSAARLSDTAVTPSLNSMLNLTMSKYESSSPISVISVPCKVVIARCERGPWRQMLAVIGQSGNTASIALHRRCGFEPIGTLHAVGFKLGRWVDTVLMQRALGDGDRSLPSK